ncbi:hypothetical protein PPERSA_01200 [Pseudocohnilembus persalinus]|uniref:Palmitoyltransferase n=1 Tax=Pseudocohnilembus persalinus TaxID=266149 RepID=A0A0V0QBJ3_PSEPJ|nr:hypothetical protein PPERSA_01200 [Pseudocohnilembus persalinus]|eukprot:KRW99554.1 hypothetical protein PPERSA_01200 [Pseudocohnilembus persalinus]
MYFSISYLMIQDSRFHDFTDFVLFFLISAATFMLYWSFFQTMLTDPGRVPTSWGFLLDDPEHKKRRYCLKCHNFKPERCHHCSTCNRCVLNMDHHCPWLNNCIGFYNRKNFLLCVFYANIDCFFILLLMYPKILSKIIQYITVTQQTNFLVPNDIIIVTSIVLLSPLLFIILSFLKFHYNLIQQNLTTIDNLERENTNKERLQQNQEPIYECKYDLGMNFNWEQIFGRNKALWLIPIVGESGKPIGDGVNWQLKPQQSLETMYNNNNDESQSQTTQKKQNNNNMSFKDSFGNFGTKI